MNNGYIYICQGMFVNFKWCCWLTVYLYIMNNVYIMVMEKSLVKHSLAYIFPSIYFNVSMSCQTFCLMCLRLMKMIIVDFVKCNWYLMKYLFLINFENLTVVVGFGSNKIIKNCYQFFKIVHIFKYFMI